MNDPTPSRDDRPRLHTATVLRVHDDDCELWSGGLAVRARYATQFPRPRTERLSPGHLVAVTGARDGVAVVVWRWYDAVVLGEVDGMLCLLEPAHGEVSAHPRATDWHPRPGTRAYLSAGLPGAEWWVAGPTAARPEDAVVELSEVEDLSTTHDLWPS